MPLQFFPDEPPASPEFIAQVEQELQLRFPPDYRQFLLEHNGGVIWPNNFNNEHSFVEWEHTWIERLLSVQDLLFTHRNNTYNYLIEWIKEEEAEKYPIDLGKLIVIAHCVRGVFQLYLGSEDYGRVYFSNYSDGEGFNRTDYSSFQVLLESLTLWDDEEGLPPYIDGKIFDINWFWANEQANLDRFQELLLAYGGDSNKIHPIWKKNVIQQYIDYPEIRAYLLSIGAKLNGCLVHAQSIPTLKFLLEEGKLDINEPYSGKYPLHVFTEISSYHSSCGNLNIMNYLLKNHQKLDLSITDHEGRSVIDRYQELEHFIQNWERKKGNLLL